MCDKGVRVGWSGFLAAAFPKRRQWSKLTHQNVERPDNQRFQAI